eukprot:12547462-Alexandrium_andersonii.AAC.1
MALAPARNQRKSEPLSFCARRRRCPYLQYDEVPTSPVLSPRGHSLVKRGLGPIGQWGREGPTSAVAPTRGCCRSCPRTVVVATACAGALRYSPILRHAVEACASDVWNRQVPQLLA